MTGAVLLLLHREHRLGGQVEDVRADLVALVADDGDEVVGLEAADGVEHVPDHGSPGHRVQDLHRLRLHPGPAACGEDDDGQVAGHAAFLRVDDHVCGGAAAGAIPLICSPGRSRTYVASPDSKSGGPCRQTNRGSVNQL